MGDNNTILKFECLGIEFASYAMHGQDWLMEVC